MRGRPLLKATTAIALFAASPAFAAWQDHASAYDVERLSHLAQSRAAGLQQAEHGASARDLAIVRAVLNRGSRPVQLALLSGHWRCRTIKLGGMTPSVVYSWFSCRIGEHNGHAYFEKLSGTQHFGGALYKHESGGYVLLGAMNWAHDIDAAVFRRTRFHRRAHHGERCGGASVVHRSQHGAHRISLSRTGIRAST